MAFSFLPLASSLVAAAAAAAASGGEGEVFGADEDDSALFVVDRKPGPLANDAPANPKTSAAKRKLFDKESSQEDASKTRRKSIKKEPVPKGAPVNSDIGDTAKGKKRKRGKSTAITFDDVTMVDESSDDDLDLNNVEIVLQGQQKNKASTPKFCHRYIPPSKALDNPTHTSADPPPWLDGVSKKSVRSSGLSDLHHEILALIRYLEPTPEQNRVRDEVVDRYRKTILDTFQNIKRAPSNIDVFAFGSTGTGLHLPWSDIDLSIVETPAEHVPIPPCFDPSKAPTTTTTRTSRVGRDERQLIMSRRLQRLTGPLATIARDIDFLQWARVPIIRCIDRATSIKLDVSFTMHPHPRRHPLRPPTLRSVSTVRALIDALPALRPLVITLKHFLAVRELNEVFHGGVGGHACVLWVATYLLLVSQGDIRTTHDPHDLGSSFLHFCEYFGGVFAYDAHGLRLRVLEDGADDGPSFRGEVFVKDEVLDRSKGGREMLCLRDVVDAAIDVTVGSSRIMSVSSALRDAHAALVDGVRGKWCPFVDGAVGLARVLCVRGDGNIERRRRRRSSISCEPQGAKAALLLKRLSKSKGIQRGGPVGDDDYDDGVGAKERNSNRKRKRDRAPAQSEASLQTPPPTATKGKRKKNKKAPRANDGRAVVMHDDGILPPGETTRDGTDHPKRKRARVVERDLPPGPSDDGFVCFAGLDFSAEFDAARGGGSKKFKKGLWTEDVAGGVDNKKTSQPRRGGVEVKKARAVLKSLHRRKKNRASGSSSAAPFT